LKLAENEASGAGKGTIGIGKKKLQQSEGQQLTSQPASTSKSNMVTKSILKMALAAEKGVNFAKLKDRKRQKTARKRHREALRTTAPVETDSEEDEWEDEVIAETETRAPGMMAAENIADDEEASENEVGISAVTAAHPPHKAQVNLQALADSDDSESSVEMEERLPRPQKSKVTTVSNITQPGDEEEDEEDIPISELEDLEDEEKEDLILHSRLTINNTTALLASLTRPLRVAHVRRQLELNRRIDS
jgi:rRNA-processing protein EBP2